MDEIEKPYKLEDIQRIIVELTLGREPENDKEREIKAELDEAMAKGYMIDLPLE